MEDTSLSIRISELIKRRDELEKSYVRAIKIRNEMDGKMQSRYDTQKEEWALEADIIAASLESVNKLIKQLQEVEVTQDINVISIGSQIELHFQHEDTTEWFILLAESGGFNLAGDITTLSAESPLGKALLGAKIFDTVSYEVGKNLLKVKIINIK